MFGVKWITKGKDNDMEVYQAKILKIGGLILIPHIYKLFNVAAKKGFIEPWNQNLIVPIFKSGDKKNSLIIRPL
jgi:hypothetical protein